MSDQADLLITTLKIASSWQQCAPSLKDNKRLSVQGHKMLNKVEIFDPRLANNSGGVVCKSGVLRN